jgi:integrase/recombinase XerD
MPANLRHIESFLEMLAAERSVSRNTIIAYQQDMLELFNYAKNEQKDLLCFNYFDLENYINSLGERHLAPKSLARKVSSLRQFYGFLLSEDYIKENPALNLELPKQPQNLPKALPQSEIEKLLLYAGQDKSREGIRNLALIELLYSTGMRISELILLKLSSLRDHAHENQGMYTLLIKGKGGKERLVILHFTAINALNSYLQVRDEFIKGQQCDYLFPSFSKSGEITHITRQRCFQLIKEIALQAGLSPDIISPHKIRHSFATHLLSNGANLRQVQELLGHADISSTQIYTKIANQQANDLVLNHHPLARK